MFKKLCIVLALFAGFALVHAPQADAGYFVRRVAPVRRAVLPPYPVARRAVLGPVYRPVLAPRPYVYGPPVYGYGPGVSVVVGF